MSEMEKWTYFLKYGNTLEEDNLPPTIETPQIRKAVRELNKFSLDNEQRARYEARMKSMRDGQALLSSEFNKGKIEGIKEGEIKGKIETNLELRFESRGLPWMNQIRDLQDIDKLSAILRLAKTSPDLESWEKGIKSLL